MSVKNHQPQYFVLGQSKVHLPFDGRVVNPEIQACINRCKIPQERLTLGKRLGKGNFGLVVKGQLVTPAGNLKTVAVKTLKGNTRCKFLLAENLSETVPG